MRLTTLSIALTCLAQLALGTDLEGLVRRALTLMEQHPLIDGHVDVPFIVKTLGKCLVIPELTQGDNPLEVIRKHNVTMPGHVDLKRMRQGRLGGLFSVAWTPCTAHSKEEFLDPSDSVRDTLEAIDIIRNMQLVAPNDLVAVHSAGEAREAFAEGRISTFIGVEGGHQLGNSLSALRLYAELGVRYVTLTHTCHNSFASSAGSGDAISPVHPENGLTEFGRDLVLEMNRLGVLVDLSHTSAQTMKDAISISQAPVLFSHSGAQGIWDHPRNVPDDVLDMIGDGPGKNAGVVMSVFYPEFVDPKNATVEKVADHIEYIATRCGKKHVGISSDFDGMKSSVKGLEDVSKYPNLIVELMRRGWEDADLADLMGGNILRLLDDADRVKNELKLIPPSSAVYSARRDLPVQWGGPNGQYLPLEVQEHLAKSPMHDEL